MESPPKMTHDSFAFRFPARLWRIINSCTTGAIAWGPSGKTVRIFRRKFEQEYLAGNPKPFKTAKYESFVRQLNHYGFKKVKKRSAIKKIGGPLLHGESKEEAAMLSEYHNPNFTRGNPERVTFLERRGQMLDDTGSGKKRTKRLPRDGNEIAGGTKPLGKKKQDSTGALQCALLSAQQDGLNTSADDNSETQSEHSRSETEGSGGQYHGMPSRAEYIMARHAVHPLALKPLPPIYAPPTTGSARMEASGPRRLLHQRQYYSQDGFEVGYHSDPFPPSARYPYPVSPPWQSRPGVSMGGGRLHLYDDLLAARDPFYRAYATDPRTFYMARPYPVFSAGPAAEHEAYSPRDSHSHAHAHASWNSVYAGLNRRVPVADMYDDGFDPEQFVPVGERLRYTSNVAGGSVGVGYAAHRWPPTAAAAAAAAAAAEAARYYPGEDPYLSLQYQTLLSRTSGAAQIRPPFSSSSSSVNAGHPLYNNNNGTNDNSDMSMPGDDDDEYAVSHPHPPPYSHHGGGEYAPTPTRDGDPGGAYRDAAAAYNADFPGAWQVNPNGSGGGGGKKLVGGLEDERYATVRLAAHGQQQQSGLDAHGDCHPLMSAGQYYRCVAGVAGGGGGGGGGSAKSSTESSEDDSYHDSLNIITDSADLPLDVAEETVVTCEEDPPVLTPLTALASPMVLPSYAAAGGQQQQRVLVEPVGVQESPRRAMDNNGPTKRPGANPAAALFSSPPAPSPHCNNLSNGVPQPQSQSQSRSDGNKHLEAEPSAAPVPVPVAPLWKYLENDLSHNSGARSCQPSRALHKAVSWTFPASRLLEETAKKASGANSNAVKNNDAPSTKPDRNVKTERNRLSCEGQEEDEEEEEEDEEENEEGGEEEGEISTQEEGKEESMECEDKRPCGEKVTVQLQASSGIAQLSEVMVVVKEEPAELSECSIREAAPSSFAPQSSAVPFPVAISCCFPQEAASVFNGDETQKMLKDH